ncbi:hypothetical protein [Streptomyces sp. 7N604]|uniref:hypothetical protein n=1 Tax=Streptomyces sp. 7N604 TaxID=3457415 RepID=UPI003FD47D48
MQRRPYAPGTALAAALLAAGLTTGLTGLTGCTGGSGGGSPQDSKPGDPAATAPAAEPGKYRTLDDPCGAVEPGTLRALLPGLEDLEEEEREKGYEGQAAITYDTDRRVGCRWQAESPEGTRHLSIDFERVVSYDPAVSDEDRAQELYDKKATAADIPAVASDSDDPDSDAPDSSTPASPSPSASNEADKTDEPDNGESEKDNKVAANGSANTSSGSSTPSGDPGDDPATAPRPLDDLADVAYLDDRLVTADSGVHRDIAVVFRASNVIVTVEYDRWSAAQSDVPESGDLQTKALRLAEELVERFG